MANMIGRLGVVLGLDSAEFVRGIDGASKKLDAFADKTINAGKIAATALTAASIAALKYADDIYDVAKANDVAIDSIVKLSSALSQSGGKAADASKFMSSFTMYVDKAATGTFEAQKNFKSLGISLQDIGNMSMDKIFAKTVESIAQINDPITRNAKAIEMFGKAAKGVDMIGFAEEMSIAGRVSDQTAKGIEQAGKFFDLMDKMAHKSAMTLTEVLTPSLTKINQLLDGYLNKNVSLINSIHDAYNKFAPGMIQERLPLYMRKNPGGQRITPFEMPDEQLRQTTLGVDSKAEAAAEKKRVFENSLLVESNLKVMDIMKGFEKVHETNAKASRKDLDIQIDKLRAAEQTQRALDETLISLMQRERLQSNQLDFDRQSLLLNAQFKDLKSYELKYAQDILSIRSQYAEQEYQIRNVLVLGEGEETKALERNNELREKAIEQAKEALEIQRQANEGSMQKGFGKAFDEFVRNMPNQLELGKQTFTSLMSNMDTALQNFVRNGKFSFGDFARSVIQDMIMIQARAQMMGMMKNIYGLLGGGSASVDLGGGAYGGGSAGSVGISGFANGGDPPVGVPSLVGEHGPELFIPKTAGTIIPNGSLSGAMAGGPTINYNGPYIASMSAIDTQSGAQFLAKNKQAVWATYQSANRSVPVTR